MWQVLHLYGEVNYNEKGTGLSIEHWIDYLPKLRHWASEFGVAVRNIERSLFEHHKIIQEGPLYERSKPNEFAKPIPNVSALEGSIDQPVYQLLGSVDKGNYGGGTVGIQEFRSAMALAIARNS